jgi:hypothetical protein
VGTDSFRVRERVFSWTGPHPFPGTGPPIRAFGTPRLSQKLGEGELGESREPASSLRVRVRGNRVEARCCRVLGLGVVALPIERPGHFITFHEPAGDPGTGSPAEVRHPLRGIKCCRGLVPGHAFRRSIVLPVRVRPLIRAISPAGDSETSPPGFAGAQTVVRCRVGVGTSRPGSGAPPTDSGLPSALRQACET